MADNLITEEKQNQQHTQTPIDTKSNSEANGLNENHSLRPLMGKYKDDPTWDEFMENIREYRREVNEKWNKIYEEEERQKQEGSISLVRGDMFIA